MSTTISPAAASTALRQYWPKSDMTPAQLATICEILRDLDSQQIDIVLANAYASQRSARREPDPGRISELAATARRETARKAAQSARDAGADEVAGASDDDPRRVWRRDLVRRKRHADAMHQTDKDFVLGVWYGSLDRFRDVYSQPAWGLRPAEVSAMFLRLNRQAMVWDFSNAMLDPDKEIVQLIGMDWQEASAINAQFAKERQTPFPRSTPANSAPTSPPTSRR